MTLNRRQSAETEAEQESRAILRRLKEETDPQIGAGTQAFFTRTRSHFAADDVDPEDRIAVLATRLGRTGGLVGLVVFAWLLLHQLSAGS